MPASQNIPAGININDLLIWNGARWVATSGNQVPNGLTVNDNPNFGTLSSTDLIVSGLSTLANIVNPETASLGITTAISLSVATITGNPTGMGTKVDHQILTGLGSDVSATNVLNTNHNDEPSKSYRINYYLETTTSDVLSGMVFMKIDWSNNGRSFTETLGLDLSSSTSSVFRSVIVKHGVASTSYIRFSTTHTGIFSNALYSIMLYAELLS